VIALKQKVCDTEDKHFVVINQKGIDPLALDMLAKEGVCVCVSLCYIVVSPLLCCVLCVVYNVSVLYLLCVVCCVSVLCVVSLCYIICVSLVIYYIYSLSLYILYMYITQYTRYHGAAPSEAKEHGEVDSGLRRLRCQLL